MKLFGWKSAGRAAARPVSSRVPLARVYAASGLGQWPRSYEAQLRDGYLNNVIAQRAVRLVAEGVASLRLSTSDERARALINATSGGQSLLETVAGHLLLHGNAYVEILPGTDGRPRELYALRPERVSVEADARGWPIAYAYRVGEATSRLPAEQVIHIRTMHPLDDHYGLGGLGAASGAIAIHNAAAKWNKALLDNAARPSGALVQEGGEALSGDQFDRLKEELATSFEGAANAGRPMLLEGGLRWQPLSLSPADMDFVGLKAAAAREIALAFGVPPMLLGLPGDATYANYREANRALWRQTILPLAGKILDAIAEGLALYFPGLEVVPDLDQVSALSEERERLWAQLSAADFLTVNEKRAAIGLEPVELGVDEEPDEEPEPEPDEGGAEAEEEAEVPTETKFNTRHYEDTGRYARAGEGRDYGGGASFVAKSPAPTRVGAQAAPRPRPISRAGGINGKGYKPTKGDAHLLARIMYAETLSNPEDFEAIGWTVVNRVGDKKFRRSLNGVIRMPRQFESLEIGGGPKGDTPLWNESAEPWKLKGDKRRGWDRAFAAAQGILAGKVSDPTNGATFFISSSTYQRGSKKADTHFFTTSLGSGRLIDSPYISTSMRTRKNHFFIEVPELRSTQEKNLSSKRKPDNNRRK